MYQKNEVKVEPDLDSVKVLSNGKQGKFEGVERKPKKRIGRGNNPRLKGNKWEIKDSELVNELKSGSVLLAYTSTDPTEPTISNLTQFKSKGIITNTFENLNISLDLIRIFSM